MFQFDEEQFRASAQKIDSVSEQLLTMSSDFSNSIDTEDEFNISDIVHDLQLLNKRVEDLKEKFKITLRIINFDGSPESLSDIDFSKFPDMMLTFLTLIANCDSNVNTSGKFSEMTEYQQVMLSYLSIISLFYSEDKNYGVKDKTLKELFNDMLDSKNGCYIPKSISEYLNFSMSAELMVSLSDKENKKKYFNLFLGNLILNGYGDLTLKHIVKYKKSGFDAIILKDKNNEYMIYFPGTDFNDQNDLYYDTTPFVPIIKNVNDSFDVQQQLAIDYVGNYLNKIPIVKKVHIGGFSLGGSLAEHAYYKFYDNSKIGDLVLYNPFHTEINTDVLNSAGDKVKIYASEYDIVSKALEFENSNMYQAKTKIVPMDMNNMDINTGKKIADSSDNFISKIFDNIDIGPVKLGNILNIVPVSQDTMVDFSVNTMSPVLPININGNINSKNLEVAFSRCHLPESILLNKNYSFDNGNIRENGSFLEIDEILKKIGDYK